jgi:hypothetical protein
MGVGAQDVMGRVAASIGALESVAPEFQTVLDVPNGGVLFALPALLAMGLLKYTYQFFKLPKGYYGMDSLFYCWPSWPLRDSNLLKIYAIALPVNGGNY